MRRECRHFTGLRRSRPQVLHSKSRLMERIVLPLRYMASTISQPGDTIQIKIRAMGLTRFFAAIGRAW